MARNKFSKIIETLETLTSVSKNSVTRSVAGGLLLTMQGFMFHTYLAFRTPLLSEINDAQAYLQKQRLSIRNNALKLKTLKTSLTTTRKNIDQTSIKFPKARALS